MLESANRDAVASQDFLTKAYKYFEEGDLVQASEKGWGAAASMVKAVAEERGKARHHRLGCYFRLSRILHRKRATRN